ncbi:MAG: putative ABC transporter permease subunit [Lacipirellulaceae bacterium]
MNDAPPRGVDLGSGASALGAIPARLDESAEARLFWRIRRQTTMAQLRQLLATSRLRTLLVVGLSLFFWAALFALFYFGFSLLVSNIGDASSMYHTEAVEFVFHLFFASLNVMLIFSAGIILYSGLFASAETRYLLTLPARPERIVLYKFQEALLFSSWGFFLLASPLTISYGLVSGAPWYYYVLLAPLILSFVYIPCGVGAILCLLLVYRYAHVRLAVVGAIAAVAVGAAALAVWDVVAASSRRELLFDDAWFRDTVRRFQFTQNEWLPSTWLSHALIEAAEPVPELPGPFFETPVVRSLTDLGLLLSNALMAHVVLVAVAKRAYRVAFGELECRPRRPRRAAVALVDRFAGLLLRPFPSTTRLMLIKDWRLLRRDPVQWSQFLIFFGLLGLYFLNVDSFFGAGSGITRPVWVNMVSFLNLAVVGLILSTFTTRFIYPMISLEGRRFWVLGLLPVKRATIVWSKFLFAALGSWGPCALLILASDLMLRVPVAVIAIHQYTTVLLCSGLAALAVGLGAMMPNLREPSPSKIAAGFGGTLNLVLSALYIVVVVVLTALPCHFYLIAQQGSIEQSFFSIDTLRIWLIAGNGVATALGVLATYLPLQKGIDAFEKLEFY